MAFDPFKWLEIGAGLVGAIEQHGYDETARKEGIQRYGEAETMASELKGRVLPSVAKLGTEQMNMLEGSGVQQKEDIRRRADERLDKAIGGRGGAVDRGLGNTTVPLSLQKGFGDFEEDQLARVDEQVRQERMQTHGYWGLLGNQLDVDLTGQQIGIKGAYNIPPQQSPWLSISELAGRAVRPPEAPEAPGTDWVGAAAPVAAKVGVALFGVPACIDGDAELVTPDGMRKLKDIQVGDKAMNCHGEFIEVVWKDYGSPAEENEYVELSCGARSLIVTVDHFIGGKPAGEWDVGEEMELYNNKHSIEGVKKVGWVNCGDIRLADDSDYVANGFVVTSQLVRVAAMERVPELEGK